MSSKSEDVVRFIANLLPLYQGERHDERWCARSLFDGTLLYPVDESDSEDERGWVRVSWQGDPARQHEVSGDLLASVALERYVRLHGVGYDEETIAAELWFMARHFRLKTGCDVYLPQLREPAHPAIRAARRMGEGVLVNLISKVTGLG